MRARAVAASVAASLLALSVNVVDAVAVPAGPEDIDTVTSFLEGARPGVGPFSSNSGGFPIFGQTITVPADARAIDDFSFVMSGDTSVIFRAAIYAWDSVNRRAVGEPLYQSGPNTLGVADEWEEVSFAPRVAVTPGATYVVLVTTQLDPDPDPDGWLTVGTVTNTTYSGGRLVIVPGLTENWFRTYSWWLEPNDVAFTVDFSAVLATLPAAPGVPASGAVTTADDTVTATWEAPVTDGDAAIESYTVTITGLTDGWSDSTTVDADTLTATFEDLDPDGYTLSVIATNRVGDSPAAQLGVVDIAAPVGVPDGPGVPDDAVVLDGDDDVIVSWETPDDDGGADIDGYDVVLVSEDHDTRSTSTDADELTVTFAAVDRGLVWTAYASATNSAGNSPWVELGSVAVPAAEVPRAIGGFTPPVPTPPSAPTTPAPGPTATVPSPPGAPVGSNTPTVTPTYVDGEGVTHQVALPSAAAGRALAASGAVSAQHSFAVTADGQVFTTDSRFDHGSVTGRLNAPIEALVVSGWAFHTADGAWLPSGYWLIAADGGVFTLGNAPFHGSTGTMVLARPIVDLVATRSGNGYWLFGADGGVFTFGDAPFLGSAAGSGEAFVGATPAGDGYRLLTATGGTVEFGATA